METQLKFSVVLPLLQMALRKLTAHLESGSDILASIFEVRIAGVRWNSESTMQWRDIEGEMKEKMVSHLPEPLKKEVIDLVRPVALQIRSWEDCHGFHLSNEEKLSLSGPSKLSFTSAGSISYRKTAQQLLHSDALSVEQRYQLACMNCLEDDISRLWEELPEESKNHFLLGRHSYFLSLDSCWPSIVRGEPSELDHLWRGSDRNLTSFNQWAFEHSAQKGNKVATEYFLPKLTERERDESLLRTVRTLLNARYTSCFRNEKTSEVCCYLMSLLSPEQQVELTRAQPVDVLFCFLDLPWQDLFSENSGLVWSLIPQSSFDDLLMKMVNRFEITDRHFPKIFREFFVSSPLEFRKYFVHKVSVYDMTPACNFLSLFFSCDDAESVEVVFRNVAAEDRVKLMFDPGLQCLLYEVFRMERWRLVEVCVQEAALSDEDMERWKEDFEAFFRRSSSDQDESASSDLSRFFDLIDRANKENKSEAQAGK